MGVSIPPVRPDASTVRGVRAQPQQSEDIARRARLAIQGARDAGLSPEEVQQVIAAWDRKIKAVNMDEAAQLPQNPKAKAILEAGETLASGVPGARLAMSAARTLTDRETPFADIQRQVNAETSDVPVASLGARILGGGLAAGALPIMSGAKAGALIGGSDQLLSNAPEMTPLQRAFATAGGAAVGGAMGGLTDYAVRAGRVYRAPNADEYANILRDQRRDATEGLYNLARMEGQMWSQAPGTGAPGSFSAPDIEPLIQRLKGSRQFANATDDEILNEAKRILSRQNQAAMEVADASPNYLPDPTFKAREAALAKAEMMQDADVMMPSLRLADEEFARQSDRIRAFNEAGDAMGRRLERKRVPFEKLPVEGDDAFLRQIPKMSPDELREAGRGVLSATKRMVGVNPQFGVAANVFYPFVAMHRAGKFINPIDKAFGNAAPTNLRDAILGSMTGGIPEGAEDAGNVFESASRERMTGTARNLRDLFRRKDK